MIPRVFGKMGTPVRFEGNAYDFGHSIRAVEFSLDEGEHWTVYETPGTNDYQNVTWSFDYIPRQAGLHVLLVRSVNDRGETSPASARVELMVEEE